MERPNHDLQTMTAVSKKSKVVSLAITIGIQGLAVLALVLGLAHQQIQKELAALNSTVEKQEVQPKAPPPPPPDLIRPPPQTTVVPEFAIEAPPKAPPAAPAPPAPPVKVAPTELKSVERTHSIPPYPSISLRLGEQGTTIIKVTIGVDGQVTAAALEKTSGFDRLDAAAVEYVKSHWRWLPPTREGKPVEATTLISVKWDLKNAQ